MKILISIGLMCCYFFASGQKVSSLNLINESMLGRCIGSAYCSACRNCSRCAHCGSGGTCGVCSSNVHSPNTVQSRTSKTLSIYNPRVTSMVNKKSSSVGKGGFANDLVEPLSVVRVKEINLHSGPGLSYPVIEKLKLNQKLKRLAKKGKWARVKVSSSGTLGYCKLEGIK